jgi:hypothetical protein
MMAWLERLTNRIRLGLIKVRGWLVPLTESLALVVLIPLVFVLLAAIILVYINDATKGLYEISAYSDRFEYDVVQEERSKIALRYMRVFDEDSSTIEGVGDSCYTGLLRPKEHTQLEFSVLDGRQRLILRPGARSPTRTNETAPSDELPVLATISMESQKESQFVVASNATEVRVNLRRETRFVFDPTCVEEDQDAPAAALAFGSDSNPIWIDGPGLIGRALERKVDGKEDQVRERVGSTPVFVEGKIDVLLRSNFCLTKVFDCNNQLYRVWDSSMSIPPGAAIWPRNEGETDEKGALIEPVLRGHAVFDGTRYQMGVSVNARSMHILLPISDLTTARSDRIRFGLFDIIKSERVLTSLASLFILVLGLLVALAQIPYDKLPELDPDALPDAPDDQPPDDAQIEAASEQDKPQAPPKVAKDTSAG